MPKRIIEEPRQQTIQNDDSFVIDNTTRGTHSTTFGDLKSSLIDATLSISGSSADAKAVGDQLALKVDAISGKGLSANDYTDAEKLKLSGVESGSQANIIESISVNGTAQTITSKSVNIPVPTLTSQLTNNSNFAIDGNYVHTDNNYTSLEKDKLSGISAGAQVNIIESISVNGTTQTITSKSVNISVPTMTSQLTNNSNFAIDSSYVHTDNNYTSLEKDKLSGISAGAQVNVIESISVNGTAQTVTNKAVNISIPLATSTSPKMNGTATIGTESTWAKGDHIHPTDTSRAPIASPSFTGAATVAAGTDYTTAKLRNVVFSTREPTSADGVNGDVWIIYEEE